MTSEQNAPEGDSPAEEGKLQPLEGGGGEESFADVLERVLGFFGAQLVEYVACTEVDMLRSPEAPENAVRTMVALGELVPEGISELDSRVRSLLLHLFTRVRGEGDPVALEMRGGEIPDASGEVEGRGGLIRRVARRLYPATLVPPQAGTPVGTAMHAVMQAELSAYRDPLYARLRSRLLEEELTLDRVFGREEGAAVAVGTSTGSQGNIRRDELGVKALHSAARRPVRSAEEFEQRTSESLESLIAALSGRTMSVDGFIALSGVRLPEDVQADFGSVVVRPMTAEDQDWISKARFGGIFELEPSPEIDRCSAIVEHKVPFRVSTKRGEGALVDHERFEENLELNSIRLLFTKLSLALLLGTPRARRPQLRWEWRGVIDPVEGMWDTQRFLNPRFTAATVDLTAKEFKDWAYWFRALDSLPVSNLEVAMSRLMRAANERDDPADVLVDAVIAWENMFGGGGELTFRITAAMATLIAAKNGDRIGLQARLSEIYDLRSRVVHGSATAGIGQRALCDEALEMGICAFKILLKDRPELLSVGSGVRSKQLLLGG